MLLPGQDMCEAVLYTCSTLASSWYTVAYCKHHTVVLQAAGLALPCREMCEAVVSTCSCGRERSLGSLLDGVVSGLLV